MRKGYRPLVDHSTGYAAWLAEPCVRVCAQTSVLVRTQRVSARTCTRLCTDLGYGSAAGHVAWAPVPTLRRNIESASLPVITWLNGLPRALPFLAILALMVAGILVPGWGWVLLLVVVLFLVWTFYLSWPALDGVNKLMRGTVIVLAIAITITQAIPKS
jgi:hypothetical protein